MSTPVLFAGAKGGVGTSTVTAMAAMRMAGSAGQAAVIDTRGDLVDMFGLDVAAAMSAVYRDQSADDLMARFAVPLLDGSREFDIGVLAAPRGVLQSPVTTHEVAFLARTLADSGIPTVVDLGRVDGPVAAGISDRTLSRPGSVPLACRRVLVSDNDPVAAQRARSWLHWADGGTVLVHNPAWTLSRGDFYRMVHGGTEAVEFSPAIAEFFHAAGAVPVPDGVRRAIGSLDGLDMLFGLDSAADQRLSVAD